MELYTILNIILILATFISIYFFWIKPLLNKKPSISEIIEDKNNNINTTWEAVKEKLSGLKQKITSALVVFASFAVMIYDTIVPTLTGIDISPLTNFIPSWSYPLIIMGLTFLFNYFRTLADNKNEKKIEDLENQIRD